MPKREAKDLGEEKIKATTKKVATKKKEVKKVEKEAKAISTTPKKRGRPKKVVENTKQEIKKEVKKAPKKETKKVAKEKSKDKKETVASSKTKAKAKTKTAAKTTAKSKVKATSSAKKTSTKKASKTSSKAKKVSQKKTIKLYKTISLSTLSRKKKVTILEYFDLPYRYNETTVKVLAQTPKILFVYWDISDHDRDQYILHYGENFFNDTYPVLLVKNETYGYVQEVPINDFANSWYLHLPDSRSKYSVELGRRYKNNSPATSPYIYIKDSNQIIVPNDHILFEEIKPQIKYRNAKTNEITFKNISHVLKNGKILDFYSLYQVLYNVEDLNDFFDLRNPSSRKSNINLQIKSLYRRTFKSKFVYFK